MPMMNTFSSPSMTMSDISRSPAGSMSDISRAPAGPGNIGHVRPEFNAFTQASMIPNVPHPYTNRSPMMEAYSGLPQGMVPSAPVIPPQYNPVTDLSDNQQNKDRDTSDRIIHATADTEAASEKEIDSTDAETAPSWATLSKRNTSPISPISSSDEYIANAESPQNDKQIQSEIESLQNTTKVRDCKHWRLGHCSLGDSC
eukprot:322302_1